MALVSDDFVLAKHRDEYVVRVTANSEGMGDFASPFPKRVKLRVGVEQGLADLDGEVMEWKGEGHGTLSGLRCSTG